MAVVCGDCRTDNRDGAKFCKGCGRRLALVSRPAALAAHGNQDDWAETQAMAFQPSVAPPDLFGTDGSPGKGAGTADDKTFIMPAPKYLPPISAAATLTKPAAPSFRTASSSGSSSSPAPLSSSRSAPMPLSRSKRARSSEKSKWPSVAMGVVAVAVLMVAGAAWYVSRDGKGSAPPPPEVAAATPILPVTTAPSAALAPDAPAAAPTLNAPGPATANGATASSAGTAATAAATAPAGTAPTPPTGKAASPQPNAPPIVMASPPPPSSSKPVASTVGAKPPAKKAPPPSAAPVAAATPAPTAAAPVATAAAPATEPAPPANPQAACASQGFFGRSSCMVAQCAKPEYRGHAQCDAVRRQQQIDEEKRNPALAN